MIHKSSLKRKKENKNIFFSPACDLTELNFFRRGQSKPKNHFNDIQNHYTVQQQQQQNTSYKLHQTCYTHAHTSQYAVVSQLETHSGSSS